MSLFVKNQRLFIGALLVVIVLVTIVASVKSNIHWTIFSQASSELMDGMNPYQKPFDSNDTQAKTWWVYSPSAGLSFFSIFNLFPTPLDRFLYLSLSVIIFFYGSYLLFKSLKIPQSQLFLLGILSLGELIGSIQSYKIELLSAGLLMAFHAKFRNRVQASLVYFIFGFILPWKFSFLPYLALILFSLNHLKELKELKWTFFGVLISLLIPYGLFSYQHSNELYSTWIRSLEQSHLIQGYLSFQSIYPWIQRFFAVFNQSHIPYVMLFVGALIWISLIYKKMMGISSQIIKDDAIVDATCFILLFSQLSQSSGFILWMPILIFFFNRSSQLTLKHQKIAQCALTFSWFLMSLVYSDLVPNQLRQLAREQNFKPLGILILWGAYYVMNFGVKTDKIQRQAPEA